MERKPWGPRKEKKGKTEMIDRGRGGEGDWEGERGEREREISREDPEEMGENRENRDDWNGGDGRAE